MQFVVLLSSLVLGLFASCNFCLIAPKHTNETKSLTIDEKNFIPYQGNEILYFTNDSGDTIILLAHGRGTYFEKDIEGGIEKCESSTTYHLEKDTVNFYDESLSYYTKIVLGTKKRGNSILEIWINAEYFTVPFHEQPLINTMNINGRVFNNVYKSTGAFDDRELYYNKNEGIIWFRLANGNSWKYL